MKNVALIFAILSNDPVIVEYHGPPNSQSCNAGMFAKGLDASLLSAQNRQSHPIATPRLNAKHNTGQL